MTISEALAWGDSILAQSSERRANSRADASLLLRHVLEIDAAEMFAHDDRVLTPLQLEELKAAIDQRLQDKPIQYITGYQEFFGLSFQVTPDVLIPRPETEHLVEAVVAQFLHHPAPRIVDVGTGSGAIAVALAHAMPNCRVTAIDISATALAIAEQNALQNKIADRIRFLQSDLLAAVADQQFDAVVSNPPYIALAEQPSLPAEVREYEPPLALFAGPTGFEIYERLIAQSQRILVSGGWLLMEIGQGQRDTIATMLRGWGEVEFIADLQNIPRVAVARLESSHASR